MATQQQSLEWIRGGYKNSQFFNGNGIDTDGMYGIQCKDFVNGYMDFLGVTMVGGNAIYLKTCPLPAGWQRLDNTPDFIPQPGDIFVMDYWSDGVNYGHTGVVGEGSDAEAFWSIDQNYVNSSLEYGSPPAVVRHPYERNPVFIRPVFTSDAPAPQLAGHQRVVANDDGVNGRSGASTNDTIIKTFNKGDVLDFKGFVRGQDPYGNGNSIWFVGAYSDTYWYSGAFSDTGTHDLPDLTPPAPSGEPEVRPQPAQPGDTKPQVVIFPDATKDSSVTAVINKKHPLVPLDYQPTDLQDTGNGTQLRTEAAASLKLMQDAGAPLLPQSGFRSYQKQLAVYGSYDPSDRDTYSARPGYSEHQTGLAMDFSPIHDTFRTTAAYTWLLKHAHEYGWINRYQDGKEEVTGYIAEPWHWRYVGVNVATSMYGKGITTLEEYFNVPGGDYGAPLQQDAEPEQPKEDTTMPAVQIEHQTPTEVKQPQIQISEYKDSAENIRTTAEVVAATDTGKELLEGIPKPVKLGVYIVGDVLLLLGAITPQLVVVLTAKDPLVQATMLGSVFATAGLFLLTMFGIYKGGQKQ